METNDNLEKKRVRPLHDIFCWFYSRFDCYFLSPYYSNELADINFNHNEVVHIYPDNLFFLKMVTVYSKVEGVKKTSFQLRHLIKDDGNEIIAEALDVIVFYDFSTNLNKIIPAELKERLIDSV